MPIYEYKCSECGNVYEKRQKFSDPVDTVCNCEKQAPVTRLTSAPALVFKGSGWYINDYAKGKSGGGKTETAAKSDSSAKADSGSSSGSSSSSTDSSSKSSGESSSPAPAGKAS
jgi:putative FmdB family regulatory protein